MTELEEMDLALDQDYPETVRLDDDNPKVMGEFVRVDFGPSEYGQVPIVVLSREGKEYGLWLFHAVLRNQFAKVKPKVGEMVGAKYLGKKKGASGREYSNYIVKRIPKAGAEVFDWGSIEDPEISSDMAAATETQARIGYTQHVDRPVSTWATSGNKEPEATF